VDFSGTLYAILIMNAGNTTVRLGLWVLPVTVVQDILKYLPINESFENKKVGKIFWRIDRERELQYRFEHLTQIDYVYLKRIIRLFKKENFEDFLYRQQKSFLFKLLLKVQLTVHYSLWKTIKSQDPIYNILQFESFLASLTHLRKKQLSNCPEVAVSLYAQIEMWRSHFNLPHKTVSSLPLNSLSPWEIFLQAWQETKEPLFHIYLAISMAFGNESESDSIKEGVRHLEALNQEAKPDPLAQYALAKVYYQGLGGIKDENEAHNLFLYSAIQNFAPSRFSLGVMAADARHDEGAVRHYEIAATLNYDLALGNLAYMHSAGRGVPRNRDTAMRLFRSMAERGVASGQYNLGYMLYKQQKIKEALPWLFLAAEQGLLLAQHHLGYLYAEGVGLEPNPLKAKFWYHFAADQGSPLADLCLSVLLSGSEAKRHFEKGVKGIKPEEIQNFERDPSSLSKAIFIKLKQKK